MATRSLPGLVNEYLSTLEEASKLAGVLDTISQRVDSVEYMVSSSRLDPLPYRGVADRAVGLLEAGRLEAALEASGELCRLVAGGFYSKLLDARVEGDYCPSRRDAVLAVRLLDAAGPLRPIVRSLLVAGKASAVAARASRLLQLWPRLSRVLSSLYQAATSVEKSLGHSRASIIAAAASAVESLEPDKAIARLDSLAGLLAEASALAKRASELAYQGSEALQHCTGARRERLPCRLASSLVASSMAARSRLEKQAKSLEELREAVEAARRELAPGEEALRSIYTLHDRLKGGRPGSLAEAVEQLLKLLETARLSREEEELLEMLARGKPLDIMELHQRSPKYSRAALRLCTLGLAHCTIRL